MASNPDKYQQTSLSDEKVYSGRSGLFDGFDTCFSKRTNKWARYSLVNKTSLIKLDKVDGVSRKYNGESRSIRDSKLTRSEVLNWIIFKTE